MENTEVYLGDGLYFKYDGFHVVLRAPRDIFGSNHEVFLDDQVLDAFLRELERLGLIKGSGGE